MPKPESDVRWFSARMVYAGMKMEALGMKRRGTSCTKIAKEQLGIKGSRAKIMQAWREYMITTWNCDPEEARVS